MLIGRRELGFCEVGRLSSETDLTQPPGERCNRFETIVLRRALTQSTELCVRKLTGLARVSDVTLRRGIIGSLDLYDWLNQIRNGDGAAYRNVVIHLMNEDHTVTVQTWKLRRARIIKHVSGPFNARASDVAMEELTLAYKRLEME